VPRDIRDHWDLDSIMESRAEWADTDEDINMDDEGDPVEGTESEHG